MCCGHATRRPASLTPQIARSQWGYPWCLCRGNIDDNLEGLRAVTVSDSTTQKVQITVADKRYNKVLLAMGIRFLSDVPCTTTIVEQGHGAAAIMRRCHRLYGPMMSASRTFAHMMRCRTTSPDPYHIALKLEEQALSKAKTSSHKVHGRAVLFLADLVDSVKESLGHDELPNQSRWTRWRSM